MIHTLDYLVYNVTVIHKTDRALLVEIEDRQVWIPISQILADSIIDSNSEPGDIGELVIPRWLGEKVV